METKKRKPGRPPGAALTISPEQVKQIETMAGVGLTMDQMAGILGMSKDTFERRAREDASISAAIEKGRSSAIFQVGKSAYQQAISGKVPAMTMFYLKCRAGWKESHSVDITSGGKDLGQCLVDLVKSVEQKKLDEE